MAVYDNKTYSLFDKIIRWLYIWCGDETKVSFAVLAKPISKVLCLLRLRHIGQCISKKYLSAFVHSFNKGFVCNLLSLMEDAKHFTHGLKQSFAVSYGRLIRKCCQVLEFSNKMCQANGVTTKGHPLVWTSQSGVPRWLQEYSTEKTEKLLLGRVKREVKGSK